MDSLLLILTTLFVVITLPGTLTLLFLTLGAFLYRSKTPLSDTAYTICVVIPAHNEANNITDCLKSLQSCDPILGDWHLHVIADNCDDDTAQIAQTAGAKVLERHNLEERGKGYALHFAFQQLLDDYEAFVVIDADTRVEKNFFQICETALCQGAQAWQVPYLVGNPQANRRTQIMHLALLAMNYLRPRGRAYWGFSVGILGNGFGLTQQTLKNIPYTASSIVEDLEYHIRLVENAVKVQWLEDTTIYSDMPIAGSGVDTQRARWEGGRLRMIKEHTPNLLKKVSQGHWKLLEPLADLLLLPLANHVMLLVALLIVAAFVSPLGVAYGVIGFFLLIIHVLCAWWIGGAKRQELFALLSVPFYILWKVSLLPRLLRAAGKQTAWVRTAREKEPHD